MDEPTYLEEGGVRARIVADSTNDTGDRVTSFEIRTHRFTLAEWNTHCLFSRNSASSRAIPIDKMLERYSNDPALPVVWPSEQPGMSGGEPLTGRDLEDAQNLWSQVNGITGWAIDDYLEAHPEKKSRLHKSLLNRLLEPMQWHTMLITAASFENFFDLRVSPHAQPEFRVAADLMQQLYRGSQGIRYLKSGQWHLPYIRGNETIVGPTLLRSPSLLSIGAEDFEWDAREISSSRCAATSYETQWADKSYAKEIERYQGLTGSGHWSPLEHVCTPWPDNDMWTPIPDPDNAMLTIPGSNRRTARVGKFLGWLQWRHVVEARKGANTYR